jgi:alpha-glucosidase
LKAVPASWDETKFIAGEVGDYIVMARRKGKDWYIGAMTNERGRKINVPLTALGGRSWQAKVWQDGSDMNNVKIATVPVQGSLSLTLAPSGGGVAILTPKE